MAVVAGSDRHVCRHLGRAMGTDLELVGVDLGPADLAEAAGEIDRLERHWSRFQPSSDLSRLNRSPGVPVALPAVTFDLIVAALDACGRTGGWFDPTILRALEAAGYDRTFVDLVDLGDLVEEPRSVAVARPAPGPALDRSGWRSMWREGP